LCGSDLPRRRRNWGAWRGQTLTAKLAEMTDSLSPSERSRRMGLVRSKDTKPELCVRSLLHRLGYRFRLHDKKLPGRPDIVLPRFSTVIFVHGCFWHRHPAKSCPLARLPKSRLDFWEAKLVQNRKRDESNVRKLRRLGWRVVQVWECELPDQEKLENRLRRTLR
jgi:DNA mismatch endonuclease (patch repair protein)